jgi:hypothetical protein
LPSDVISAGQIRQDQPCLSLGIACTGEIFRSVLLEIGKELDGLHKHSLKLQKLVYDRDIKRSLVPWAIAVWLYVIFRAVEMRPDSDWRRPWSQRDDRKVARKVRRLKKKEPGPTKPLFTNVEHFPL